MAGTYMVHVVDDNIDYGPFSLVTAKTFARIGAKEGRSNRVVWRRDTGRVVREYEAGSGFRLYPLNARQARALTVRELPSEMK